MVGCPIRTPADQFLFADPRSFSQLITSFFASESLGIPHTPFLTSIKIRYRHRPFCKGQRLSPVCPFCGAAFRQHRHFLLFYLLFHQYVNELFEGLQPRAPQGWRSSGGRTRHPATRQQPGSARPCLFWLAVAPRCPAFLFQFPGRPVGRQALFLNYTHGATCPEPGPQYPSAGPSSCPCGEYRSRTDGLLLAKQAL